MPELAIEQDADPPIHKKLMSSSWVKSRLCCCCRNDGKATNPVMLTKAETITIQPTTSAGIDPNLPANGNAKKESHVENVSVDREFDEIDLTEVRRPASTSSDLDQGAKQKNKPMQGTVASGVTDMMLDEIYEEKDEEEHSEQIEEPDNIDTNAIMEATDEEVVNTLSRKTHAPQILAKMEGEILRVEKLEAESPEEGRKLQRSSVLMNLDTLKSIDSDSDRHEEVPVKPSRSNFEEKTTVVRKNPFDEEDDETKYSLSGSNDGKVEEASPKPPTPNPSMDTILSDRKDQESARKSPEISPISDSEKLEAEAAESESKTVLNLVNEEAFKKSVDMQEIPLERPNKTGSPDEGLETTDDETTTSTDYELKDKAKSQQPTETTKPVSMYGNISSDESSESEDESIAPDRVKKSPNRVSIKKNSVVITKVSIDANNPESPSTGRVKQTADYVVLTDDEFSEKII